MISADDAQGEGITHWVSQPTDSVSPGDEKASLDQNLRGIHEFSRNVCK